MADLVNQVLDRLERSGNMKAPLFLIIHYEHETAKLEFIGKLRRELAKKDCKTASFDPAHRPEHRQGKLIPLLTGAAGKNCPALLSTLPRLEGSGRLDPVFLDYLNVQRDNLFKKPLRLLLFIHSADAEQFIHAAGDLWDFRHHTFWLERKRQPEGKAFWQTLEDLSLRLQLPKESREEIESHVRSVKKLVDKTGDKKEKAGLLLDLSRWLNRRYAYALTIETALEGLGFITGERTKLAADLEHELGYALDSSANLPEALEHYLESLEILREIGDRAGEGVTLNNISQIYDSWGRYQEALDTLKQSLEIRREIGDRAGEGVTLNNISQIYKAWGRYEEALETLKQSLEILREIGDRAGEGVTLNNISQIYDSWERYDEALETLKQSLEIRREIGDRAGEGATLNNIAGIYHSWGRYEEALETLKQSLEIRREIGDRAGEGATLNNIAGIYHSWGRYEEALETLKQSLEIRREIGDRAGEGATCWNLALEYERRGQIGKAVEMAACTVEIEKLTNHPDLEKDKKYLDKLRKQLKKKK